MARYLYGNQGFDLGQNKGYMHSINALRLLENRKVGNINDFTISII